ncbi:thioredoxin-like protein [Phyllosticta citricarpa]|uniref:Thioredoxin-like protein n=1 Tax=Phyllosticta citricarpa TaxID=55181 RepID=A0ABR1MGR8_9PEZI
MGVTAWQRPTRAPQKGKSRIQSTWSAGSGLGRPLFPSSRKGEWRTIPALWPTSALDWEPLRLGSIAPNFKADTTTGPIDFHDFIGDNWVVLFSHPEDYTPVCTTELGAFAKLEPEFTKRGVKLIGLSANTIDSHDGWIKDINEVSQSNLKFPIIGDKERKVALAYDMIDHQDATNVDEKGIAFTIRSVFIIDPKKTIRTIFAYPASTGRNAAEVLRVIDSLQTGDKHKITTPINWVPGDDVIVHPTVKTEDAQKIYPNLRIVKPYLRFTPLPKEQTSANV